MTIDRNVSRPRGRATSVERTGQIIEGGVAPSDAKRLSMSRPKLPGESSRAVGTEISNGKLTTSLVVTGGTCAFISFTNPSTCRCVPTTWSRSASRARRALRLAQLFPPEDLQPDPPLFPVPARRARVVPSSARAAQRLSQRAAASRRVPLALVKAHRHVRLPPPRPQRPSHEGVDLLLYLLIHRRVAARHVVHVHALAPRVPRRAASERARPDDRVQQRRERVARERQLASQRRQRERLPPPRHAAAAPPRRAVARFVRIFRISSHRQH